MRNATTAATLVDRSRDPWSFQMANSDVVATPTSYEGLLIGNQTKFANPSFKGEYYE